MDAEPLKFFCIHCGLALSVPRANAGVTGPCPRCAAEITAPAAPQQQDLASELRESIKKQPREKQAHGSSLRVQPREVRKRRSLTPPQGAEVKEAFTPQGSRRRSTAVDPFTSLSHQDEERKSLAIVIKIFALLAVVIGLCAAVVHFLLDY